MLLGVNQGSGEQAKLAGQQDDGGHAALQFDKAEVVSAGLRVCASCNARFEREYFEAGGRFICPTCASQLRDGQAGPLLRAAVFGALAALGGTLVWFLVIKLSGSEFGLIAIAVGLGVGFAVRYGAGGRGGVRYQALAMALTYFSITASYVPLVIQAMANAEGKGGASDAAQPATTDPMAAADKPDAAPERALSAPAKDPAEIERSSYASVGSFVLALLLIFGIALASPFLSGVSNIMGIIIIGIALYEAWKLNKRVVVTGPYLIGAATEAATP